MFLHFAFYMLYLFVYCLVHPTPLQDPSIYSPIHPPTHSFNKYLQSIYYVPNTVLGTEDVGKGIRQTQPLGLDRSSQYLTHSSTLSPVTLEHAMKYVVGAIGHLANIHPLILPC